MQNIAAKKRERQRDKDSDYLFARPAFTNRCGFVTCATRLTSGHSQRRRVSGHRRPRGAWRFSRRAIHIEWAEFSGAVEFCPICMWRGVLDEETETFPEQGFSESTLEVGVERFEHYELVKGEDGKPVELGGGAMGVTYKAFDVDLRCPVTLKVISEKYLGDESARLRFLREARAAASLRHPNVASVFHLGRIAGVGKSTLAQPLA